MVRSKRRSVLNLSALFLGVTSAIACASGTPEEVDDGGSCEPACGPGLVCQNGACVPSTGMGGSATGGAASGGSATGGSGATSGGQPPTGGLGGAVTGGTSTTGGGTGNTSGGGSGNVSGSGGSGNAAGIGGTGNLSGSGGVGNQGNSGGGGTGGATAGAGNTAGQPDPGPSVQPGQCKSDLGGYQNGSVTFYTFSMGTTLVNCSYGTHRGNPDTVDFVSTNNGQYFAAIATSDYNRAATCGACIEVTRDGNRKVVVTVADQCPIATNNKCKAGHLDLSRAAFLQIGSENEGYLGTGNGGMYGQISWKYIPCPTQGNVHFRLKEPSNANWNQLLVENTKFAITKVEVRVNGSWVNATRQEYNFWEPPDGRFGTPPYRVRVTDVNGTVLEDTVDFAAGDQEAANQMTCQ